MPAPTGLSNAIRRLTTDLCRQDFHSALQVQTDQKARMVQKAQTAPVRQERQERQTVRQVQMDPAMASVRPRWKAGSAPGSASSPLCSDSRRSVAAKAPTRRNSPAAGRRPPPSGLSRSEPNSNRLALNLHSRDLLLSKVVAISCRYVRTSGRPWMNLDTTTSPQPARPAERWAGRSPHPAAR